MSADYGKSPPFRHELAATILAASRFLDIPWKIEAITRAKKLLEDDPDCYMNALAHVSGKRRIKNVW
jgi:hypothetical protein